MQETRTRHGKETHGSVGEFSHTRIRIGAYLSRGLHEVAQISKFNADNGFVQAMSKGTSEELLFDKLTVSQVKVRATSLFPFFFNL